MDKPGHLIQESTNYRSFKPKEKNFMTAKVKKGGLDQVLFSTPGYNSIGEPYQDPSGMKLRGADARMRMTAHGKEFRPGGHVKSKYSSDFLNSPTDDRAKGNFNRTTGPRGFFTSPLKHGVGPGTLIQKGNYGHMADEYDRKRDLARQERMKRRSMQLGRPFSNVVKGRTTFGSNNDEYGEGGLNLQDKTPKQSYKGLMHEKPFKYSNPPKKGYEKTINKFPDHKDEGGDLKGNKLQGNRDYLPWRPAYLKKTEPSDSITANYRNRPQYSFVPS
jgi:hypothetical protein